MKSKRFCPSKNSICLIFICLLAASCGVKGRPQAPTVETPIGYGSPEADAEKLKKKNTGQGL